MLKKSFFLFNVLLIVILIFAGVFLFRKQLVYPLIYPINNVFDEMYFSGKTNSTLKFIVTNSFDFTPSITDCNYNDYKIYRVENWLDRAMEADESLRRIYYNDKNLPEKTNAFIDFDFKKKKLSYVMLFESTNGEKIVKIQFDFNVTKNILTNISPLMLNGENNDILSDDIDDINNFLKEHKSGFKNCVEATNFLKNRIIEDWINANPQSRFSKDNYGEVTYNNFDFDYTVVFDSETKEVSDF